MELTFNHRLWMSALILAFSLALSGCFFYHPVDTDVGKWIVKIKKSEEKSKEMVKNILATVKDHSKIQNARNLYVEAEAQNNACITLLKIGIIEAQDISKDFKNCTKTADVDSLSFLKYGKTLTSQPIAPFSILQNEASIIPIGDVIDSLFKGGIAIWKAYKDEDREDRKTDADYISKQLTWPSWEQIK